MQLSFIDKLYTLKINDIDRSANLDGMQKLYDIQTEKLRTNWLRRLYRTTAHASHQSYGP